MSQQSGLLAECHREICQRLGAGLETLALERVTIGVFFTGVILNNGVGGLCATPIKSIPEAVCCPSSAKVLPRPGRLQGRPVSRVLEDLYSTEQMRRALAIATLNALVETLWQRDGAPDSCLIAEGDAFQSMRYGPQDRFTLVGAFPPYMRALRKAGQPFHILEMDPATLKDEELPFYVPAERAATVLPHSEALIVTGTTLTNGTLEALLALCKPGCEIAVIGPTAPLLCAPFTRRGVTVIGGVRVEEPGRLLDRLAEGASGYHFFEDTVKRITLIAPQAVQ